MCLVADDLCEIIDDLGVGKVLALRGASKPADPASESPKSKKRRAMAGCKDDIFRASSGYKDEASCNARVLGGDVAFMLDIMDAE